MSVLKAKLLAGGALLGVLQSDPEGWLKGRGNEEGLSDDARSRA